MAEKEEKQKFPQRLYDANGVHTGNIETDDDTSSAEARSSVIEAAGKTYVWDQRNAQWREADVLKGGNVSKVEQPEETAPPAEPATPATPAEPATPAQSSSGSSSSSSGRH